MIIDFSDIKETTKMPYENNKHISWETADREKCFHSRINQSVLNTTQFHRKGWETL